MSTYKQIAGTTVKAYTTNPSDPQEGEMWYNQTTLKLRGVTGLAAYSSAPNVITSRTQSAGGGNVPSSFFAGGFDTANSSKTEEYNGSGYSSGGTMGTARRALGGNGPSTAGLVFGGYAAADSGNTEEYDGTSWSEQNNLSTTRFALASANAAPQTAALAFGGYTSTQLNNTEHYDGTSWTNGGNLNTADHDMSGFGTQTAAVMCGGSPNRTITENYDGSSWTSSGALSTGRELSMSFGTQTDGATVGGKVPPSTTTTAQEDYNGATWSTSPATLATKRGQGAGSGTSSSAIISTGAEPGLTAAAEEYNFSAQVVTAAAWSSGGNLSTARQRAGGFGNAQNSAAVAAGATSPPASALSATEEYDGSAWSSGGSVNTARFNMTAFGTETAGVLSGVGSPSTPYGGTTEEYDGSTWTTVNPYAAPGANYRSSCGPQTAGLLAGGVAPPPAELNNAVEEYDGTNWTSGTNLPQFQSFNLQAGTQTAAINAAGAKGPAAPGPVTNNDISLEYDGTNWTSGPNANILPTQLRSYNGGTGTQTAAMLAGGETNTISVRWDGTTFATDASYPTARGETSAAGLASAPNAILFAGYNSGALNTTVEYSEESTSVNSVDITTAE
jgi:hypothetical protein